ncbi:uncharacterized protein LOC105387979 [Plutella xylostella]|uniref:uncharacterized protein LOC105387979 n=1 Tax=Plutella xylostella TaxID=51655 RepID=UPI002032FB80|nr:uncharacterized protein LOC105387979 [Plutella xylostella]
MASPTSSENGNEDAGVFGLLTQLCNKTASQYSGQSKIPQKLLASKMRSRSYELILKKYTNETPRSIREPLSDLLFHYYTSLCESKNVAEYNRSIELKKIIDSLKQSESEKDKEAVYQIIRLLVGLSNSVKDDLSDKMFQRPFSFGLLDQMLPKPPREPFGSPQPYTYYPPHVFQLPYSIKAQAELSFTKASHKYPEYSVECFDSKSLLQGSNQSDVKTFLSPMSLSSMTSTYLSPYPESFNIPRLKGPRDLQIPQDTQCSQSNIKVSMPSSTKSDIKEVFKANSDEFPGIWELASQVDKDIPTDIWDIVAKLPMVNDRQLIASCSREMALWRQTYGGALSELNVVSERQFIRHVMYLIIGIETNSFPYNKETNCFNMKPNLSLEGISKEHIRGYVSDLLLVGTYYRRLFDFAFNQTLEDHFHNKGLVFEAARDIIRKYLLKFRLKATEIYEECCSKASEDVNCMPTLLQIRFHVEPLKYEIETIASIYLMIETEPKSCLPSGAELMSYLFNEISLVTHKDTSHTVFNALFSICNVYFKFIDRFIFEGELDDPYHEFFIRKDSQYVNSRSKKYWDKGFHISQSLAVPEFLRALAKCILLCGKSLRLMKLCNPSDPLVLLISSDHPTVKCCANFEDLERQQNVLDVYRTRCLFVSGEPVTFEQILLKREAERKAFTEMASIKQAETLEKIVAERKRLAQLIIAEKQHSLRVLEAAMAEAKAFKNKSRQRERRITELEREAEKASEEVDSKMKVDERSKIMEYYSKLNMEVEKSKIHMEWKIKRLQLDQTRMQLLSTEERNYKREKLEREHQKIEEVMAMSIRSDDEGLLHDSDSSGVQIPFVETPTSSDPTVNKANSQSSSDAVFVFRNESDSTDTADCDNKKILDAQGNVETKEVNSNEVVSKTSSDVIGCHLNDKNDNIEFLRIRQEALSNKDKVMAHEFGTDNQNNTFITHLINLENYDEENNVDGLTTYQEAKRNKLKVLGAEFDIKTKKSAPEISEPITEAQKEAIVNKQKVMGVEYNLPSEEIQRNQPANIAQEEALVNKQKVMGVEYNLPADEIVRREPANTAQEEALVNKQKVMGVEYNLPPEAIIRNDPANIAQEEALVNKGKILGVEYNLPAEIKLKNDPANTAQHEAVANRDKILGVHYNQPAEVKIKNDPANTAQEEALKNRDKILGVEYNLPAEVKLKNDPANVAQREAVTNRYKILGVEFNLPAEERAKKTPANAAQEEAIQNRDKVLGVAYNLPPELSELKVPANYAQEEAMKNRRKMLGSDYGCRPSEGPVKAKRAGLTLNLRPCSEVQCYNVGVTPNTGAITPAEFFPRLDLETPTTADNPLESQIPGDLLTPNSETSREIVTTNSKSDKDFLSRDGFNFSLIVDEETNESENTSDLQAAFSNESPSKYPIKSTPLVDIINGSYSLEDFDPFGMKQFKKYSKDHLSSKMDLDMYSSCYTHPSVIMEEVKKKPYKDIFASHSSSKDDDETTINCDNIATLTACLQRSVMLPLTYQLEVVNNSILTHFLVNLDMYEHLRSLKDYFFLMDGEFSKSICHNLFSKLVKTVNPQELLNFATLHNILDKALGSSISHVHKFSENLSFTMSETPLSFQHSSPDVLHCLSLTYLVGWPLNIILSHEALLRYAKVFQFLVKMRRISWVLGEDFESLKLAAKLSRQESRKLLRSPQYISTQLYRHIMASLIRALDNYIVTTCILTSWTEFENDLKKARTLDDLYDCHVVYIKKVLFRCLLNNRSTPVMKLLNDIFIVILKFSRVLNAGKWYYNEATGCHHHPNFVQLQELFHLFEKLAKYLHKVVMRLMECGYQRHLAELLTLVNLNGYYNPDKSKSEPNNSLVMSP